MLLTVFLLAAFGAFLAGSLARALLLLRLPPHSRWELYPVPKEKGRAVYGGSYYEETFWWRRPHLVSLWSELRETLREMLFIKRLYDHRKPLWWFSYSFHLGLYCLTAFTALLVADAAAALWGCPVTIGPGLPGILYYLTAFLGGAGMALGLVGTCGLLGRRLFLPSLRLYSGPREYLPLLLFLGAYVTGLIAQFEGPFATGVATMKAMIRLEPVAADGPAATHLVLLGLLLIYIPFSKLSHYVAKFFSFHRIQWDNEPYLPPHLTRVAERAGSAAPPPGRVAVRGERQAQPHDTPQGHEPDRL